MIIQSSDDFVVGRRMEHFPDLLQEAFPVQGSGTNKSVFSKKDVLTF